MASSILCPETTMPSKTPDPSLAMPAMSRAILGVSNQYGASILDLGDKVLTDFAIITAAFAGDFKAEMARRGIEVPTS